MSANAELTALRERVRDQEVLIQRLTRERDEPIAIVGMGIRFPGDNDTVAGFADFLAAGSQATTAIPPERWDVPAFSGTEGRGRVRTTAGGFLRHIDQFDPLFFNISPKEARCIDPQQRLVLETSWTALEHANIAPDRLRHSNAGVYLGASSIDYALELGGLADEDMDGHIAAGLMHAAVSGRVSYFLGLRGPSITVDTACSASLVALRLAMDGLRGHSCDLALCGGVNAVHHPHSSALLSDIGALAVDGRCKTFDDSADGYGRAEGCGVIVLKRLSDAERDGDTVLALVRGCAVRQDGESAGLTVPNGIAQEAVMRAALDDARVAPASVRYVEAHGTGTPLGDPIELAAINGVFGDGRSADDPLLVASLKTNFGHLEAAAGVGGLVKTVLQLRNATVYPHLNLDVPSSRIPWGRYPVRVPTRAEPWPEEVRRAVVNSFGFAGTIASAVLEQAPARVAPTPSAPTPSAPCPAGVFTLSAKTRTSLARQVDRHLALLDQRPDLDLGDLCHTTNVGRAHLRHRVAGVVDDRQALVTLLERARTTLAEPAAPRRPADKVAFLFAGQGAQYPGMGAVLYRTQPAFARELDECDRLLSPLVGRSLRALVTDESSDLDRTRFTQPALFAFEYALARLWQSLGVRPNAVAGHSIGELTAATVAGVFSLADAAAVVAARATLMDAVRTPGGMVAVYAPAEDVTARLPSHPNVTVAAINGPRRCVLSGAIGELTEVVARLTEDGIECRRLAVSQAFHSPLMREILDDFRAVLLRVRLNAPELTVVSTVTGTVAVDREITDPEYWVRQLVAPVDLLACMRALHGRGRHVFVEIGPSPMLTALARRCVPAGEHSWAYSIHRSDSDGRTLYEAATTVHLAGTTVDWARLHQGHGHRPVDLPTYSFDHKRYWLPVRPARPNRSSDNDGTPTATARPAEIG